VSENQVEVALFAPVFPPSQRGGGPVRTLAALVDGAPTPFHISVVTPSWDVSSSYPMGVLEDRWVHRGGNEVLYARKLRVAFAALRRRRPTVVYLNSFFNVSMSLIPQLLIRLGYLRPSIRLLAPRGEFGLGALRRHARRKRVVMWAYRVLGLHRGLRWHASSEQEALDIVRAWGAEAAVFIRENETGLPPSATRDLPERDPGVARLAFVGRIVEHKGLHVVIDALAQADSARAVHLDVYGPEEDPAYLERCRSLIAKLPDGVQVEFRGLIHPDDVRDTLSAHELMALPTAGENFGQAIAEALSVSVPVMTTSETPWTARLIAGAGIVVPTRDPRAWRDALSDYLSEGWESVLARRAEAARSYDDWMREVRDPHVLEMVNEAR
jgi:glycosyltransferase involved in cell wall biosynthesis